MVNTDLPTALGLLCEAASYMDGCKICDPATWTEYDQSLRDRISQFVTRLLPPAQPFDDCKPTQRDLSMVIGFRKEPAISSLKPPDGQENASHHYHLHGFDGRGEDCPGCAVAAAVGQENGNG